eukprot:1387056-Pleurochrysis_carterae.AAC.1
MVGIEARQLYSFGAVGARGGWDRNPAYRFRARGRGEDSQRFRYSANVTYCPIRHWESGDGWPYFFSIVHPHICTLPDR